MRIALDDDLAHVAVVGPATMKAAYFMQHGGPEVFQYSDLPDPVAGGDEVLVDMHAASVNGADWRVRQGTHAPVAHFPHVPGRDFSAPQGPRRSQ